MVWEEVVSLRRVSLRVLVGRRRWASAARCLRSHFFFRSSPKRKQVPRARTHVSRGAPERRFQHGALSYYGWGSKRNLVPHHSRSFLCEVVGRGTRGGSRSVEQTGRSRNTRMTPRNERKSIRIFSMSSAAARTDLTSTWVTIDDPPVRRRRRGKVPRRVHTAERTLGGNRNGQEAVCKKFKPAYRGHGG